MWEGEQSCLWFVNIFFFLYVKVALTDHERWPKTKQSEDQLLASSTVYAKCNYHALLLYQTHSITSPHAPPPHVCLLKGDLLNYFNTLRIVLHLPLVSAIVALPDPGRLPASPLRIRQIVSNEIHINMCVGVCSSLRSSALSLSPTASFHSSLAQIHALERLLKGSLFIRLTKWYGFNSQ